MMTVMSTLDDVAATRGWQGPRYRGASIGVGVVLCLEALISPIVYWVAFAFIIADSAALDAMARLGNWGVLVLAVPLVGAAIAVLVRPSKLRVVWAMSCLLAAVLNAVAAIGLLVYNVGRSDGPIDSRLLGVAFGLAFGLVAGRLVSRLSRSCVLGQ
jgi:hypothetical protein